MGSAMRMLPPNSILKIRYSYHAGGDPQYGTDRKNADGQEYFTEYGLKASGCLGYENGSKFSKAFKEIVGVTPGGVTGKNEDDGWNFY